MLSDRRSCDCLATARAEIERRPTLPLPGGGATWERWAALATVAERDLSVARLVEGHHDAVAILHELGVAPPGGVLAVWAARPEALVARRTDVGWRLEGSKPFCSGAGLVDAALVVAAADDGPRLFLVPGDVGEVDAGSWSPLGMGATASATVRFAAIELDASAAAGGPRAYTDRPGFGHGGCGVAACWLGGARAVLADLLRVVGPDDDLALFDLGQASTRVELARLALRDAARQIDGAALDVAVAERLALETRWAVADAARVVVAAAERHRGTSSLAVDVEANERLRDLVTYLSQHRDRAAVELGRRAVARGSIGPL